MFFIGSLLCLRLFGHDVHEIKRWALPLHPAAGAARAESVGVDRNSHWLASGMHAWRTRSSKSQHKRYHDSRMGPCHGNGVA